MIHRTWAERLARKKKRRQKSVSIFGRLPIKGNVKKDLVTLLGLLDRKKNGPDCRIHGGHPGQCGYHIFPQMLGDAYRFIPENVVWACFPANRGEQLNRSLYAEKHVEIFGQERLDLIRAKAKEFKESGKKYSLADLIELRKSIKEELGR